METGASVIELAERHGTGWWALIRERLAACWWRLLVVEVLFGAAVMIEQMLGLLLKRFDLGLAGDLWMLAAGGLATAWRWSTELRILDGGHGILPALMPDLHRIRRLWGWLVALNILGLLDLLIYVDSGLFANYVTSPLWDAVRFGALYVSFASALLPMAVLLEGRGADRAWRLSHGDWRTTLRVLAVVLLGSLASAVLHYAEGIARGPLASASRLLLVLVAALLIYVMLSVLTTALLYAAYCLSPHRRPTAQPAAT